MRLVTLDVESFWSPTYSLSKMSPLEYVMGDEFELISLGIKVDDHPTDVFFGEDDIRAKLIAVHSLWDNAFAIAHNMSGFDAYVLAYYLGIRPKMWGCTLAMARPIHAKTCGVSLAALVKHYGLGAKNSAALINTRGKRLADFTGAELLAMEEYNRDDTDQCHGLFHKLKGHYTAQELWQIDSTIRMRTEPAFELDTPLLHKTATEEKARKHGALLDLSAKLNLDTFASDDEAVENVRAELASAPRFAALLESLNVEVPTKPSPTNPEKTVPALAKTDQAFIDLQEHDNDLVAAAARARLDVKSTLLETRIQKFLTAGSLAGGRLPIPLRHCGADTTGRDSGEEYNCFTGDVEVLTPTGWTRFDAWQGEPIMQWWPDGTATFEQNPATLVKDYSGQVVDVEARSFSATMTPEHRIPTVRGLAAGPTVVDRTAGFVANASGLDNIPASGLWEGAKKSSYTADEVRLMVAIAADGCVLARRTTRPAVHLGFRKARKVERMRSLLRSVGLDYTERRYPPQAGHHGEHDTVHFHIPDCPYPKGIGAWVLQLDRDALDALVDELVHWDGWMHRNGRYHQYTTTDAEEAAWVATAWHLSGWVCPLHVYAPPGNRPNHQPRYSLLRGVSRHTTITTAKHVQVRDYSGKVYCAGVGSSYIFIRRNGKIAVAGQCQNLPRVNPDSPKPTDALRMSLRAPAGKTVIVADQSGIELRINHFLWKVAESMALYQASPDKADLYRAFAAVLYGKQVEDITKPERHLGKLSQLGLGFGAGTATFQRIARVMGGIDIPVHGEEGEMSAERIVRAWRTRYADIVAGWKTCGKALGDIAAGREAPVDPWGLIHTCAEGFVLPSGRLIRYPDLREEENGAWDDGRVKMGWVYAHGRHKAFIHSAKADENIVQALARDSVFDCSLEFYRRTGLRPALRVHDELVYVVDEAPAQDLLAELQSVMRTPPKWWPELVVWSEGDAAKSYGEAKG